MQAPGSLTPEQESVLVTTFRFVESATTYFRSVLPIACETDERLLKALVDLGEACMANMVRFFQELRSLADDRENRGGAR